MSRSNWFLAHLRMESVQGFIWKERQWPLGAVVQSLLPMNLHSHQDTIHYNSSSATDIEYEAVEIRGVGRRRRGSKACISPLNDPPYNSTSANVCPTSSSFQGVTLYIEYLILFFIDHYYRKAESKYRSTPLTLTSADPKTSILRKIPSWIQQNQNQSPKQNSTPTTPRPPPSQTQTAPSAP
jgi:hypothetical protein